MIGEWKLEPKSNQWYLILEFLLIFLKIGNCFYLGVSEMTFCNLRDSRSFREGAA